MLLSQAKALLHRYDLKAQKRLGQHFLIDEDILASIVAAAGLTSRDIVIEVGPGLGVLTRRLAEAGARVLAVELDARLVELLKKELASFSNVEIIHADILKLSPRQLLEGYSTSAEPVPDYKVVANLPYYISSPVLRHFLQDSLKPASMLVMLQKEVGEAVAASPGKMRLLSVIIQFYGRPTIVSYVPAKSFYPSPKVDSVVLRIDSYARPPIEVQDVESFFDIVSCGFRAPRKQLRNSLSQALEMPSSQTAQLLERAEIDARRRAETLSLAEWEKLWRVFVPFRSNVC